MLARRFTVVCLLAALFGMLFASLVAQAGPGRRAWAEGRLSCAPAGLCLVAASRR